MTIEDRRYWVLDPAGHRTMDQVESWGRDGEMVDTAFGPAQLIVVDSDDVWVCDMCNEIILTQFGAEPFPVPMFGSYALCLDHFNESKTWPIEDDEGEPIPGTTLGEWPARGCGCGPCRSRLVQWINYMERAYDMRGAA